MNLSYADLKARHRDLRDGFSPALSLRTHRALSWLDRAEREAEDDDARFIFMWISLNAAYANEVRDRERFSERRMLLWFLGRLIDSDKERLLYETVWQHFSESIRLLIDNKYVFQPFWDHQSGLITEEEWLHRFEHSRGVSRRALGRQDTRKVIAVVMDRLYTLRNQLLHGGATWNSRINRVQIADGSRILGLIVPIVIHLMMQQPNQLWGDPCYPVLEGH